MICGIFCRTSLPYGWTASQKDLIDFQSLSLVRTVSFVETEVHSFIKGLVISYQKFNFSQFKVSLLLPIFCDLQWPFLLLTAPPITWLLVAPLGSAQGERHQWNGGWLSFYIISLCCWQFSLDYQTQLCEASGHMLELSWEAFICRFFRAPWNCPGLVPYCGWTTIWLVFYDLPSHSTSCTSTHTLMCMHTYTHTKSPTSACTSQSGSTAWVNLPQKFYLPGKDSNNCSNSLPFQCCLTQGEHTHFSASKGRSWACRYWHLPLYLQTPMSSLCSTLTGWRQLSRQPPGEWSSCSSLHMRETPLSTPLLAPWHWEGNVPALFMKPRAPYGNHCLQSPYESLVICNVG